VQEEARDFEDLKAELDARMHELVTGTGKAPEGRPSGQVLEIERRADMPAADRKDATRIAGSDETGKYLTLEEVERRYIRAVLEARNWRVSGPKGAALVLGLNPSTLRSRMKKLGISRDISRNREI
jgi:transcriptional regulator with GAF, ATPase, and Fis domain